MLFILKVLDFGFPLNQTKHTWLEYVKNYDKKYKKKTKNKNGLHGNEEKNIRIFIRTYSIVVVAGNKNYPVQLALFVGYPKGKLATQYCCSCCSFQVVRIPDTSCNF